MWCVVVEGQLEDGKKLRSIDIVYKMHTINKSTRTTSPPHLVVV